MFFQGSSKFLDVFEGSSMFLKVHLALGGPSMYLEVPWVIEGFCCELLEFFQSS